MKIKIAFITILGFAYTMTAQTGDNYFNGNNYYKGISWQAIKSRFYSYGGNESEAKWLLHNIPEQGGRFVVVAGPVEQIGSNHIAFSIEGNKDALFNGNVGIGTNNPKYNLHVLGKGMIQSYSPTLKLRRDTDKGGFIQGIQTEYLDGTPNFYFGNIHGEEWVVVKGQYNGQRLFTIKNDGNVGIGTTTTGSHKLAVEGSIGAREIKVEASGWSDFVFEDSYNLPTLKEVEAHIKEKGHLKDIPSAKEVEKNGFYLGEMDAKLLQKIEELTLYTIEQEKKLQSQDEEIELLKGQQARIEKLEKENKALKTLLEKVNRLEKLIEEK